MFYLVVVAIAPVLNWFEKLTVIGVSGVSELGTAYNVHKNKLNKNEVIQFLPSADIDIADFEIREINFNLSQLPNDISPALRDELSEKLKDAINITLMFLNIRSGLKIRRHKL